MKKTLSIVIVLLILCSSIFSQKMTEPKLLGNLTYGDDPSEFLLHSVMERSEQYLQDTPDGKLIIRICSTDDFQTAFVKSVFNPLSVVRYNEFTKREIVPYKKIFIAKSSKCLHEKKIVYTQHWFVPSKNTLEFDEIFPIESLSYNSFVVDNYDVVNDRATSKVAQNKYFSENIKEFVNELKDDPNAKGFIVHNSKNRAMKLNIEKIMSILRKENISINRVKTVVRHRLEYNKYEKIVLIEDEKRYFPNLEVLAIKK